MNRGEDIFISVWNLHRSPKHWNDADKFIPERWPLDGPNPNETNQEYRSDFNFFYLYLMLLSGINIDLNGRMESLFFTVLVTYHLVEDQENVLGTCLLHLR